MTHRNNDAVKRTYQKTQQPGGHTFASEWHRDRHNQGMVDWDREDRQRNDPAHILKSMASRQTYTTDRWGNDDGGLDILLQVVGGIVVTAIVFAVALS